jgi:hypothetical protein
MREPHAIEMDVAKVVVDVRHWGQKVGSQIGHMGK